MSIFYFMGFHSYCLFKPDAQFKLNKILSKFSASEGGLSNFCHTADMNSVLSYEKTNYYSMPIFNNLHNTHYDL